MDIYSMKVEARKSHNSVTALITYQVSAVGSPSSFRAVQIENTSENWKIVLNVVAWLKDKKNEEFIHKMLWSARFHHKKEHKATYNRLWKSFGNKMKKVAKT